MSRRDSLKLGVTLGISACASPVLADNRIKLQWADDKAYAKDSEDAGVEMWDRVHGGKRTVAAKRFPFSQAAHPANFITYDIPPNASEGVHTHLLNDSVAGSFDEFYYVVSGEGQMEIDGEFVPVAAGDHVFTPIGVPHGIENTSAITNLKVLLTFITR